MNEIANHSGKEPWPPLDAAAWWFDKSSFVLACSLFVGFVATVVIIWMGIVKEHHWELLREQAALQINDQGKEVERLHAANLELEAKVQPRRLTGENSAKLADALAKIQPLPIGVVSRLFDPEGADFADDLSQAFNAAHWQSIRQKDWTMSSKGVAIGTFDGTAIPRELADELLAALESVNVKAVIITISKEQQNTTSAHFQPNALYLLIGAKP
ncbi:hypothetical protein [Bradyrhizobium sp. SZCCHNS1054]|uniref:hypothetical protein n=1 Tax=Bradyrhizobium sp. SZCCHNS1054 TaxID=3057301 RepID=UPI00291630D6|nr:hypothetical protein [Bradyrhizobium sp. SZCCHNS1054]